MFALLKSTGSWRVLVALVGFANGAVENPALLAATAQEQTAAPCAVRAPLRGTGMLPSGGGSWVEREDVRSEAAAAALSGGAAPGGGLAWPAPEL